MKKMNPVVHFELPAHDRKRMAGFYSDVFGWDARLLGEEMGNYVMVSTVESDENGRPKRAGAINGGLYPARKESLTNCPSLVIAVDDIEEAIRNINKEGGGVIGEPVMIPGVGTYVSFKDTEGNVLSILKPLMS